MPTSEVRAQLNALVNSLYSKQSRILVENRRIPVAAIVSSRMLEQLEQLNEDRQSDIENPLSVHDVPTEEFEEKVAEMLAEVRAKNGIENRRKYEISFELLTSAWSRISENLP